MKLMLRKKPFFGKVNGYTLEPTFWTYLYCNDFFEIACKRGFESCKALEVVELTFYLAKMSQEKYSGDISERDWLLSFLHYQIEKQNSKCIVKNHME